MEILLYYGMINSWLSVTFACSGGAHTITEDHEQLSRHCVVNLGGNMTQFSEEKLLCLLSTLGKRRFCEADSAAVINSNRIAFCFAEAAKNLSKLRSFQLTD